MNQPHPIRRALAMCILCLSIPAAASAQRAQPDQQIKHAPGMINHRFSNLKSGMRGPMGGTKWYLIGELYKYDNAATSDETNQTLDHLAQTPLLSLGSIGKTIQGRDIKIAVIADPPVEFDPAGPIGGRESIGDRTVVLLFGSIHAGELCGTDALLRMIHDFVGHHRGGSDMLPLLEDLVICIIPIYNADGHADFAPDNRPGQNGPDQMGKRHNAQGLDLNRDWIKMDAPETRAMVAFFNAWDPAVIVDTHTTNGSNHRFTLTYQGPKHPAGDAEVIEYVRDTMLPALDNSFENFTGYDTFFYGNFAGNHTKWTTYPAEPWYGVAYRGLRNRVSILTEAYAYAPFKDRVISTQAFCEEVLRYTAAHKDEIRTLIQAADARTAGLGNAPLATKTKAVAFEKPVKILGYQEPENSGAHSARATINLKTAPHKTYTLPLINNFIPTETVDRPTAYIVPAAYTEVIDRLRAHGVKLSIIPASPTREIKAGIYTINSVERSEQKWQNRTMMTLAVTLENSSTKVNRGDIIVRTDQPLGSLAAYMLEPTATGGLAAWGFFYELAEGGAYPIARLDNSAVQALSRNEIDASIGAPTSEIKPEEPE